MYSFDVFDSAYGRTESGIPQVPSSAFLACSCVLRRLGVAPMAQAGNFFIAFGIGSPRIFCRQYSSSYQPRARACNCANRWSMYSSIIYKLIETSLYLLCLLVTSCYSTRLEFRLACFSLYTILCYNRLAPHSLHGRVSFCTPNSLYNQNQPSSHTVQGTWVSLI